MAKIIKKDVQPICPHCERRMDRIVQVKGSWFSFARVYCCPFCEKVLGVGASGS